MLMVNIFLLFVGIYGFLLTTVQRPLDYDIVSPMQAGDPTESVTIS